MAFKLVKFIIEIYIIKKNITFRICNGRVDEYIVDSHSIADPIAKKGVKNQLIKEMPFFLEKALRLNVELHIYFNTCI